jgi:hypothetical protein
MVTNEQSFSPRLYECEREPGEYATLSHCWGKKEAITTTTATLELRKKGIAWSELSKTFQDAVVITGKLGLRYIWIDSLCIIQDDLWDWEIESKKMADIYEASMLTIAAAKAQDGESGCFTKGRESTKIVSSHRQSNGPFEVWYQVSAEHEGFADWIMYPGSVFDLHLFDRAWCLQEELLAQRVLYYTEDEVVWQCKTLLDCRCGRIAEDLAQENMQSLKLAYEQAIRDNPGSDNAAYLWSRIVMHYTSRKMTKETDRFPALSGLAKVFQTQGLGDYVAGLWTKQLPLWLTWRTVISMPTLHEGPFTAPSWSWASIMSGTQIYFGIFKELAQTPKANLKVKLQIKDVGCKLASSDATGAIEYGSLTTSGPTVDAICVCRGGDFFLQRDGMEVIFNEDIIEELMRKWEGHTVHCLLICVLQDEVYFIVLAATGNANSFRRIGMAARETVQELGKQSYEEGAISYSIMERWFESAEQREFTII